MAALLALKSVGVTNLPSRMASFPLILATREVIDHVAEKDFPRIGCSDHDRVNGIDRQRSTGGRTVNGHGKAAAENL
jgi:hypothetical protein